MATLGQLVAKTNQSQPKPTAGQPKASRPFSFEPKNDIERIAKHLAYEMSSIDFERAPESLIKRIVMLLTDGLTRAHLALTPQTKTTDETSSAETQTPAFVSTPLAPKIFAPAVTELMKTVSETIASSDHPDRNDDRLVVLGDQNIAAIFDGVGDSDAAVEGSIKASELLSEKIKHTASLDTVLVDLHTVLVTEKIGSGTTAALARITETNGQKILEFAQVGDSRISVWHKQDGSYELAALDDRLIRFLLVPPSKRPVWMSETLTKYNLDPELTLETMAVAKLATVLDQQPDPASVSDIAKMLFMERGRLTQSLGTGDVRVHTGTLDVTSGDRILLATDGLHDNLTEQEIISLLGNTKFEESASLLVVRAHEVALSNAPRAKKDDITAIVLEIQ